MRSTPSSGNLTRIAVGLAVGLGLGLSIVAALAIEGRRTESRLLRIACILSSDRLRRLSSWRVRPGVSCPTRPGGRSDAAF